MKKKKKKCYMLKLGSYNGTTPTNAEYLSFLLLCVSVSNLSCITYACDIEQKNIVTNQS